MRRWWLAVALMLPMVATAAPVTALNSSDVTAFVKPPAKGVRVLAFWALDCAYCESNLQALAALKHKHPELDVVTVATDSITQSTALAARLHAAGVDTLPAFAYADASPERLNFLIDPSWGGETPRTLVIRADGSRLGISGELTPAKLARIP